MQYDRLGHATVLSLLSLTVYSASFSGGIALSVEQEADSSQGRVTARFHDTVPEKDARDKVGRSVIHAVVIRSSVHPRSSPNLLTYSG